MKEYWDTRYMEGGMIWGNTPSQSALHANDIFKSNHVNSILVPGSGYGRHTSYFFKQGYHVEGIEISKEAIRLARTLHPEITYYNGSVLDMPFSTLKYDAIYCFNVLHLFMEKDRHKLIKLCMEALIEHGIAFFTVFSEQEPSFGNGSESELNTFESKPGRPVHYFSEDDLLTHFSDFEVMETNLIRDNENHGDIGEHEHILRTICVRKI
ncbi:MAG: class I SAM-dependent methyltransferase [Clostridia bacterium]|nr:class I SAM-dependent methyltransferase [Clostridia bacterium]